MTEELARASRLELPSREDVERGLELAQADRDDLPGLYYMNVERIPLIRMVGFTLALLLLPFHNVQVLGRVD